MRRHETGWASIAVAIILWVIFMIGLGFTVRANWKLFMIGWNLWS